MNSSLSCFVVGDWNHSTTIQTLSACCGIRCPITQVSPERSAVISAVDGRRGSRYLDNRAIAGGPLHGLAFGLSDLRRFAYLQSERVRRHGHPQVRYAAPTPISTAGAKTQLIQLFPSQ